MNEGTGYVFNFQGHGAFSPDGRVTMNKEEIDAHNAQIMASESARIRAGAPVVVYPAGESRGEAVKLWAGENVGTIIRATSSRAGFYGARVFRIRWRDTFGREWYGQGSGGNRALVSRRCKA